MRKGLIVFGVFLLIIGFLLLLFAGMQYSNDTAILNSSSGQIGLASANQTEINQINQALGTLQGIMAFGGIILIIGAVITALGFRGECKKERKFEEDVNHTLGTPAKGNEAGLIVRKCRSCGKEFKNDEEARNHECPNVIGTKTPGVWKPKY